MQPGVQEFQIDGEAGKLEGLIHAPDDLPRAIAIIAHPLPTQGGTMENKVVTTLAKTFASLGCVAVRFNFRGTGRSEGKFDDGNGEMLDVETVARFSLREHGNLPLILAGFSFGAYVQARAALQLNPRGMVLVAPAVGRFAMPAVPSGTLVIHGDRDDVVPLGDVLAWAQPQHLPVVVLAGADHFFHGYLPTLKEITRSHFLGIPL